jgi:hypothetical protein
MLGSSPASLGPPRSDLDTERLDLSQAWTAPTLTSNHEPISQLIIKNSVYLIY